MQPEVGLDERRPLVRERRPAHLAERGIKHVHDRRVVALDDEEGRTRLESRPDLVHLFDVPIAQRRHVASAARFVAREALCAQDREGFTDGAATASPAGVRSRPRQAADRARTRPG